MRRTRCQQIKGVIDNGDNIQPRDVALFLLHLLFYSIPVVAWLLVAQPAYFTVERSETPNADVSSSDKSFVVE